MKVKHAYLLSCLLIISAPALAQESPEKACKNAAQLYADDDFAGALEEAKWCVTLLEQEQLSRTTSVFPDSVNGFSGAEVESQNAMGFSAISRQYSKQDRYITVTLNGGASGTAMDAFSALAQLGMSMGKKMRIQKRTATVIAEDGNVQIMVNLKKGGMLLFESSDVDESQLTEFAQAFPVEKLDDSRP